MAKHPAAVPIEDPSEGLAVAIQASQPQGLFAGLRTPHALYCPATPERFHGNRNKSKGVPEVGAVVSTYSSRVRSPEQSEVMQLDPGPGLQPTLEGIAQLDFASRQSESHRIRRCRGVAVSVPR